jgi:hypothetical protein
VADGRHPAHVTSTLAPPVQLLAHHDPGSHIDGDQSQKGDENVAAGEVQFPAVGHDRDRG